MVFWLWFFFVWLVVLFCFVFVGFFFFFWKKNPFFQGFGFPGPTSEYQNSQHLVWRCLSWASLSAGSGRFAACHHTNDTIGMEERNRKAKC